MQQMYATTAGAGTGASFAVVSPTAATQQPTAVPGQTSALGITAAPVSSQIPATISPLGGPIQQQQQQPQQVQQTQQQAQQVQQQQQHSLTPQQIHQISAAYAAAHQLPGMSHYASFLSDSICCSVVLCDVSG